MIFDVLSTHGPEPPPPPLTQDELKYLFWGNYFYIFLLYGLWVMGTTSAYARQGTV